MSSRAGLRVSGFYKQGGWLCVDARFWYSGAAVAETHFSVLISLYNPSKTNVFGLTMPTTVLFSSTGALTRP